MKKLLLIFLIPIFSFTQSGDTNGDGLVNLEDLFNVLDSWLQNVNDNDSDAMSNVDEMINLVDSLITLNQNINYGLSIEGWIEHDFQSNHSSNEEVINTAQSSGIVLVHGCNGSNPLHQISINGQENIYNGGVQGSDGITTTFPVKQGDEFSITHYCNTSSPSFPEPIIYFFSFGDSNYGSGSSSVSNSTSSPTLGSIDDFKYPEGKNGEYVFMTEPGANQYYQVPEGKNLYIIGGGGWITGMEFPFCNGFPSSETLDYTYLIQFNSYMKCPIIKSQNMIKFTAPLSGFLLDENDDIEIVNHIIGECDDQWSNSCFSENYYTIEENEVFVYLFQDCALCGGEAPPHLVFESDINGEILEFGDVFNYNGVAKNSGYRSDFTMIKGPGKLLTNEGGCAFIAGYIINVNE